MERDTVGKHKRPAEDAARHGIQVIARAASVLRALEGEDAGLSLSQIAQRVRLARSTVQRIVESLSAEQFLIAAGPSAGVKLGPALLRLAASASPDFTRVTRPILQELSRSLGETVDLSVLKAGSAVFVDQVTGSQRLRAVSAVGERFPVHCTANGKALLSVLPSDGVARLLPEPLERFTPSTLNTTRAVLAQVATARRTGVAFDLEEHTEGICAVGTAYLDPLGRPAAISVPVPTARFQRNKDELVRLLLDARDRITALLQT